MKPLLSMTYKKIDLNESHFDLFLERNKVPGYFASLWTEASTNQTYLCPGMC